MKCPGLHCLGCRSNGSGAGVLIIGGAIGGAIWLADRVLAAAVPVLAAATPYVIGLGIPVMIGTFAYVAIAWRRDDARLRRQLGMSPRGRMRTRESRPAVSVTVSRARALPARRLPLSTPQARALPAGRGQVIPGQVISEPARQVASGQRQR